MPDQKTLNVFALQHLSAMTDEVLRDLVTEHCSDGAKDASSWAVNWADLFCYEARRWLNDEGQEGYQVTISEACPDNADFQREVQARLKAHGFEGVEVVTEW